MPVFELTIGGDTKRSSKGKHPVTIDWDALPDASQEFVIRYGLKQYLADGMAGAEDEAEAKAGVAERKRKLIEADFSRTRGEGSDKPDTVDTRALKLARAFIREKLKAANAQADKDKIAEAAKALIEADESFRKEAKKQLDAEAKSKENLGGAADAVLADILAAAAGNAE